MIITDEKILVSLVPWWVGSTVYVAASSRGRRSSPVVISKKSFPSCFKPRRNFNMKQTMVNTRYFFSSTTIVLYPPFAYGVPQPSCWLFCFIMFIHSGFLLIRPPVTQIASHRPKLKILNGMVPPNFRWACFWSLFLFNILTCYPTFLWTCQIIMQTKDLHCLDRDEQLYTWSKLFISLLIVTNI